MSMMQVNDQINSAFMEYVSQYDMGDVMISSKVFHTMRVAKLCMRIAKSLNLSVRFSFLEIFIWYLTFLI